MKQQLATALAAGQIAQCYRQARIDPGNKISLTQAHDLGNMSSSGICPLVLGQCDIGCWVNFASALTIRADLPIDFSANGESRE